MNLFEIQKKINEMIDGDFEFNESNIELILDLKILEYLQHYILMEKI
jgi:hypothetical protein